MINLMARCRIPEQVTTEDFSSWCQRLGLEVEQKGSHLKVWQTMQNFHMDDYTRIYSKYKYEKSERVAIAFPCYVYVETNKGETLFTIISVEREALTSMRSLLEALYEPVNQAGVEAYLSHNRELSVQSARWYNSDDNCRIDRVFDKPVPLHVLLGTSKFLIVPSRLGDLWASRNDLFFGSPLSQGCHYELVSVAASIHLDAPVRVWTVYLNRMDHLAGLDTEDISLEDDFVINWLVNQASQLLMLQNCVTGVEV